MKIGVFGFVLCLSVFCCCAKDKAPAPSEKSGVEAYIEMGSGAYSFKYDKSGALKSFIAVGRAKMSTLFDKDGDDQTAMMEADLDARAWMVQVFDSNNSYSNSNAKEQIVEMTAKGDNEAVVRQENGKSTTRVRTTKSSAGSAKLQGLQKIGSGKKNGYCYVVYAWDRDVVKAIKKITEPAVKKVSAPVVKTPVAVPRTEVKSKDFVRATPNASKYF